jgi:hypothetical protein
VSKWIQEAIQQSTRVVLNQNSAARILFDVIATLDEESVLSHCPECGAIVTQPSPDSNKIAMFEEYCIACETDLWLKNEAKARQGNAYKALAPRQRAKLVS